MLGGTAVTAGQEILFSALNTLTFTAAANAYGAAYTSFMFQVRDDGSNTAPNANLDISPNTLTLTVKPVNDAPVAVDDSVTVSEDSKFSSAVSLIANDTDVDGPGLAAIAGTFVTAQGGTLVLAADGSYTYTPALNFTGTDSVDYTVTDGTLTDVGTLTLTVTPVNDAPVAVDDSSHRHSRQRVQLGREPDCQRHRRRRPRPERRRGHLRHRAGRHPALAADGGYTYTPALNFTGTDSVDYTVTDGTLTDVGTLTATVTSVNDAPVAVADTGSTSENVILTVHRRPPANDTDPDSSDTLSVSAVNGVAGNVANPVTVQYVCNFYLAADGSYSFDPGTAFDDLDCRFNPHHQCHLHQPGQQRPECLHHADHHRHWR